MKVRIPKIALPLAFAVHASYATVHLVRTVNASDVIDRVLFYADVPELQRCRDQLQNASGADEPDLL